LQEQDISNTDYTKHGMTASVINEINS